MIDQQEAAVRKWLREQGYDPYDTSLDYRLGVLLGRKKCCPK